MKKSTSVIIAFVLLVSYSCRGKIDYVKEGDAIKAVLEEETAAYYASDFQRWSAVHVQDSTDTRISSSKSGIRLFTGWETIAATQKAGIETKRDPVKEVKKIHRMKIYGESAWVVYDNIYLDSDGNPYFKQVVTNILEKQKGSWKIVLRNFIGATSYYQADNNILLSLSYIKSIGKNPDDLSAYVGDNLKATWNRDLGYRGFVSGVLTNWQNTVPAGELKILEQDDNHCIFTASQMFPALKNAPQFNVTYDEYLALYSIAFRRIADYMGSVYTQETTPEGVKITVTRK